MGPEPFRRRRQRTAEAERFIAWTMLPLTCLDPEPGATGSTVEAAGLRRAIGLASPSLIVALIARKSDGTATARALEVPDFDLLVSERNPADAAIDACRGDMGVL